MDTYGFYILKSVRSFDHKVDSFQGNTEEKAIYKKWVIWKLMHHTDIFTSYHKTYGK